MAQHQAAGTVYEHTTIGRQDEQAVAMVNHWSFYTDNPNDQFFMDITDIADYLETNYKTHVLPLQMIDFELLYQKTVAVGSYLWDPITYKATYTIIAKDERNVSGNGGVTPVQDPMPTFCAAGVRKLVDKEARAFRGSTRLICLEEGEVTQNTINTGKRDLIESGMDTYYQEATVDSVGNSKLLHGVVFGKSSHSQPGELEGNPGVDNSAKIIGVFINQFVSSQVSRKRVFKVV